MKFKDILKLAGIMLLAYKTGEVYGKIKALDEVLNDQDELPVDKLSVKLCKGGSLTVLKRKTEETKEES